MADSPLDILDHFLWSKLSKNDRDLAALSAFKTSIRKKDLSSLIVEIITCVILETLLVNLLLD